MTPVDYLKILCQIAEAAESFGPAIVAAEREGLIDEALKRRIVAAASDLWQIEKLLKVDRRTADEIGLHRMAVWREKARPVFARIEMPPGRGWVGEGIAPHDWSYGVEWVVTSHYGDEEGTSAPLGDKATLSP